MQTTKVDVVLDSVKINGFNLSADFDDGVVRVSDIDLDDRLWRLNGKPLSWCVDDDDDDDDTVYWLDASEADLVLAQVDSPTVQTLLTETRAAFAAWGRA